MTEAQYWAKVRSALRRGFRFWPPISDALLKARRDAKGEGRQKYEYQCNHCNEWFKRDEVEVDHIIPCGSLKSEDDIKQFLRNLTAEEASHEKNVSYQVLCKPCHRTKTSSEK